MNFSDEQNNILQKAIDTWGEEAQNSMVIGELGELLTLYGRKAQGRDTEEDWISEIADVLIIVEQLARMHGYNKVKRMVDTKMERLKGRLSKYDNLKDTNNDNQE